MHSVYSGAAIKKIRYLMCLSTWYSQRLNKDKFLFLLASCPNLEEIEFTFDRPTEYLYYMIKSDLVLKKLKNVIANSTYMDRSTATYYLQVI